MYSCLPLCVTVKRIGSKSDCLLTQMHDFCQLWGTSLYIIATSISVYSPANVESIEVKLSERCFFFRIAR